MDELDDLLAMLPEGSFKNKEELGTYISQNGITDLYDGIQEGVFKDANEYTNYFSSLKKKVDSDVTSQDKNLDSEAKDGVGLSATPQDDKGQLVKDIDAGKYDERIDELQAENDEIKENNQQHLDTLLERYKQDTSFNTKDFEEVDQTIDEENNGNFGWMNKIREIGNRAWTGMKPLNPKEIEVNKIKKQLSVDQNIPIDDVDTSLAEEQYIQNRKSELNQSKKQAKTEEFIETLSDEDKNILTKHFSIKSGNLNASLTSSLLDIESKAKQVQNINKEIEQIKANHDDTKTDYSTEYYQRNQALKQQKETLKEEVNALVTGLGENQEDLLSTQEELDLFKRNYGTWENFSGKLGIASEDMVLNLQYLLNKVDSIDPFMSQESFEADEARIIKDKQALERKRNTLRKGKRVSDINGVEDLTEWALDLVAEQVPNTVLMATTGGASLPLMGATAAGGKLYSLEDEERRGESDYSGLEKYSSALLTGTFEALSEKISLGQVGKAKRVFSSVAKKELKDNTIDYLKKNFPYYVKDILEEGGSEALSQFGENLTDKYLLGKDVNLTEGLDDAFFSGAFMSGVVYKFPQLAKPFIPKDVNQKIGENFDAVLKINSQLENDLSETTKNKLISKRENLLENNKKMVDKSISDVDNLSSKEKGSLLAIENETYKLRKQAKEINEDNLDKDVKESLISDIDKNIESLNDKKDAILKPKEIDAKSEETTAETKEQEVETTTPEPEVESKKGVESKNKTESTIDTPLDEQTEGKKIRGKLEGNIYTSYKTNETFTINVLDGSNGKVPNISSRKNKDIISLSVTDNNYNPTAIVSFLPNKDGTWYAKIVQVTKNHRRKGVASAIYDFVEKEGFEIVDSKEQLEDGKLFKLDRNKNKPNERTPTKDTQADADIRPIVEPSVQQGQDNNVSESIDIGTSKATPEIDGKQTKSNTQKAKELADTIRKAKISRPDIFSSATPASIVWDGAIETVATTIETGGKLADAIAKGVEHIKNSDWYKKLSDNDKKKAIGAFEQNVSSEPSKTKPPKPPKSKPKKAKSSSNKKQSRLSERFLKGNNKKLVDGLIESYKLNNTELEKTITEKTPKYGLVEYERRRRETVYNNAVKFIDKVGVFSAYNAIEKGDIKNSDTKNAIYAIILERQSQEIINIAETIKNEDNANEMLGELSDFFMEVQSEYYLATVDAGQGTSMISYLLEKGHFVKYDLSNQIALEKQRNGGQISTARLKELRDRNKKIKEQAERIKELEAIQDKAKAQDDFDRAIEFENLLNERFKKEAKSKKITKRTQVQGVIDKLDALEKKLRNNSYSDASLITPIIINGISAMKTSIKIGANAYDVIEKGIENIKKELDKIGKKLPNETELREDLLDAFLENEKPSNSKEPIRVEDGKIIITRSVLRELVEEGIKDIDIAAKTVRERNLDILEDFTIREVRDALTDYGKTRELDKGDISTTVRKLRRLGVLLSKIDDAKSGNRPLRTGMQRDATTPEERELNKLLNDLLDKLPVDQVDLDKKIKTALDKRETTLKNAIEDLELQIKNKKRNERTVKSKKTNPEIERLEALKKAKQEELTAIVGAPAKTLEQKLQTRKNQLDNQIKKLDEALSKNDIGFKEKSEPITDAEIESKEKRRDELLEQLNELRETQGIIEQQRLKTRKTAVKRAIEARKKRIRDKDFSKRQPKPLKEDAELKKLRRENLRLKELYDIEAEKQRLRDRGFWEKTRDVAKGATNAFRAFLLTLEMSFVGIQGFVLMTDKTITRRNIKNLKNKAKEIKIEDFKTLKSSATAVRDIGKSIESFKALSESLGSMVSEKEHKNSELDLKNHPYYEMAKKYVQLVLDDGLQDEHFVGTDFINDMADLIIQSPLRFAERNVRKAINKKYPKLSIEEQNTLIADALVKLNPLKAVERGNARFLNDLRLNEFITGVEALEANGKTEETHPQDYKALGMMVNTVTGTTTLNPLLKQSIPLLNLVFLAFRFTVSMANQSILAPIHFAELRGENWADDIKKGKLSYAQKRYAKLMTKSYAMIGMATYGLYWASMMAWMDDEDKEEKNKPRIEFDPRSSDFMSVIQGDVATGVLGSRKKWFVVASKLWTHQTKKNSGDIVENGVGYNVPTDLDIALNFGINHANVLPGYVLKYWAGHNEVIDGEVRRVPKFEGEDDVDIKTQMLGTYPLVIQTYSDLLKEDPYMLKPLMVSAFFGQQISIYERKYQTEKMKIQETMDKRKQRPKRPSRDEQKEKRDKKIDKERELREKAKEYGIDYIPPKR